VDRLKRGDLVVVALPGDFGKPRPALVLQSDLFLATHPSVTVLPITSEIRDAPLFRITVEPARSNGLRKVSQIMVDKPMTFRRDKIGPPIGRLDDDLLVRVNRALVLWLGIAG
jgi:mRNA interferase MazF